MYRILEVETDGYGYEYGAEEFYFNNLKEALELLKNDEPTLTVLERTLYAGEEFIAYSVNGKVCKGCI